MGKTLKKSVIKRYIDNIRILRNDIITLNNYNTYLRIEHAFTWHNTIEGYYYWKKIYTTTSVNEFEKALRSYLIEQNKIFIRI